MIKTFFAAGLLLTGSIALSASGANKRASEDCIAAANLLMADPAPGLGLSNSSFHLDQNGTTFIAQPLNLIKRTIADRVETIQYKATRPQLAGRPLFFGGASTTETIKPTVVITRDASGRLTNISKQFDSSSELRMNSDREPKGYRGFPIVKSIESEFSYNGDDCSLIQTIGTELKNENSAPEKKVYYDKKFCEMLASKVEDVGAHGAAQCADVIGRAQMVFDARNSDLTKDGKTMKKSFSGSPSANKDYSSFFHLGMAIQSCALKNGMPWAYGAGSGAQMSFGFGIGTMGGGIEPDVPAKPGRSSTAQPARQ